MQVFMPLFFNNFYSRNLNKGLRSLRWGNKIFSSGLKEIVYLCKKF